MAFFSFTKILLKSLFKKPATIRYPFAPRKYFNNSRGQLVIDIDKCIFCGLCVRKCPTQAIVVEKENKNWIIERMRCIVCGGCVEVCPKKCLHLENQYSPVSRIKKREVYKNA